MENKHEFSIMLIVLPLLIVGLLAACTPAKSTADDVTKAAAMIAEFDLPEGYQPELSVHMLGYTLAGYNPGDGHSHLYLIQSENAKDGEKLTEALAQFTAGDKDSQSRMTVTETRTLTVRGQDARLILSEGTNSEGNAYRQATAAFQGKGGPALVMITEPGSTWNQDRVDAFLASIR